MTNEQKNLFEVTEVVEGIQAHFGLGVVKNNDGKIRYLRQEKKEDGSVDEEKTTLFVRLYIAGEEEKNEKSNFKDYALSLARGKLFKDAGIDLGKKLSTPVKIRFTIRETFDKEKGSTSVLRTLTNVACKNSQGEWAWIIQPKKSNGNAQDISDDDLPF